MNADIYHVDVSRYVQKPVSTVHAMFKYWFKKVAWHRPAVLVLDNLDKLLCAEVEVRPFCRALFCRSIQFTNSIAIHFAHDNSRSSSSPFIHQQLGPVHTIFEESCYWPRQDQKVICIPSSIVLIFSRRW